MTSIPYPLSAGTILTGDGEYAGFTAAEEGDPAASAKFVLYDNATEASGPILENVTLSAGQSTGDQYERPRLFRYGVFAVIVGTITGSVFA